MKKLYLIAIAIIMLYSNSVFAGWLKLPSTGQWFYGKENGQLACNGWEKIGENYYYFNEKGILLQNTKTPDGKAVDANGAYYKELDNSNQDTRTGWYKKRKKGFINEYLVKLQFRKSPTRNDNVVGEWKNNEGYYIDKFEGDWARALKNGVVFGWVPREDIEYDEAYNNAIKNRR